MNTPDTLRADSYRELRKLHPGNRLRLMFGLPLLPQDGYVSDQAQQVADEIIRRQSRLPSILVKSSKHRSSDTVAWGGAMHIEMDGEIYTFEREVNQQP